MDKFYLGIVIGALSPIALALLAKAIKRIPRDIKSLAGSVAGFIRS
jgi:hypothetical protein